MNPASSMLPGITNSENGYLTKARSQEERPANFPERKIPKHHTAECIPVPLRTASSAFALVSVLAILALILVLVLSISSVLHVETRTSASGKNVLLARQNALLGLDTAIAQLQQYAGKDQAVTFPATTFYPTKNTDNGTGPLFDDPTFGYRAKAATAPRKTFLTPTERTNWDSALKTWWNQNRNPHWTGIGDASLRRDGTPSDKFGEPKRDQLPVWLVSGNEKFTITGNTTSYPSGYFTPDTALPDPDSDDTVIWMVGNGTVSSTANQSTDGLEPRVKVKKVSLNSTSGGNATGHYAYWVADESTKANFAALDPFANDDGTPKPGMGIGTEGYRNRLQVPQRIGWENISMNGTGNATFGSLPPSFDINDPNLENITTSKEIGLLEAAATGSSENSIKAIQDATKNNFHSLTAWSRSLLTDTALGGLKKDLTVFFEGSGSGINATDPVPDRALYDPADPRFGGTSNNGFPRAAATTGLPEWETLKNWHDNDQGNLGPVLAHYQIFTAFTHKDGEVQFHVLPLIFLWNPYDVPLASATYTLEMRHNIGLWKFGIGVNNPSYVDPPPPEKEIGTPPVPNPAYKADDPFDFINGHKIGDYFITPLQGYHPNIALSSSWFFRNSDLSKPLNHAVNADFKGFGVNFNYRNLLSWGNVSNVPTLSTPISPGQRFSPFDRGPTTDGVTTDPNSSNATWVPYTITSGFAPGEIKVFSVMSSQEVNPVDLHNKSASVRLENGYDAAFPASYWFPIATGLNREPGVPAAVGDEVRWYAERLQGNTPPTISVRLLRGGNKLWEYLYTGSQDNGGWYRSSSGSGWSDPDVNNSDQPNTWKKVYHFDDWATVAKNIADQRVRNSPIQAMAGNRILPFTPSAWTIVPTSSPLPATAFAQSGVSTYTRFFANHNPSAVEMDPIPEIELARNNDGRNNQDGFQTLRWWVSARGDSANNWSSNQVTGDNGYGFFTWQDEDTPLNNKGLTNLQTRLARADFNLLSLGQLQQANIASYIWQPGFTIGNSEASPWVDRGKAGGLQSYRVRNATANQHYLLNLNQRAANTPSTFPNDAKNRFLDLSYVMNEALWDRYFLSAVGQNSRHVPVDNETRDFDTGAAHLENRGALNINSTSVEAWKALLTSFRNLVIQGGGQSNPANTVPVSRNLEPQAGPVNFTDTTRTQADYGANSSGVRVYDKLFGGFRYLTDGQIQRLAERIVDEIRLRGPFYSLADFVNRRLVKPQGVVEGDTSATESSVWGTARTSNQESPVPNRNLTHAIGAAYDPVAGMAGINGTIQRAINVSGINGGANYPFADDTNDRVFRVDANWRDRVQGEPMIQYAEPANYLDTEHLAGVPAGEVGQLLSHAPGFVTQGDILAMLGPALTPRGDTFLVRTYGDAVDKNGKVLARAYLEAVVQRVAEPVTPQGTSGAAKWTPTDAFGRKFKVVSLRWLNPEEV